MELRCCIMLREVLYTNCFIKRIIHLRQSIASLNCNLVKSSAIEHYPEISSPRVHKQDRSTKWADLRLNKLLGQPISGLLLNLLQLSRSQPVPLLQMRLRIRNRRNSKDIKILLLSCINMLQQASLLWICSSSSNSNSSNSLSRSRRRSTWGNRICSICSSKSGFGNFSLSYQNQGGTAALLD